MSVVGVVGWSGKDLRGYLYENLRIGNKDVNTMFRILFISALSFKHKLLDARDQSIIDEARE